MKILVLNCGSSSLKYQLFNAEDESVLAKGIVERIGIEGSKLTHKPTGKDNLVVEQHMEDHEIAVKLVLDALTDANSGVISDISEIAAVGHRVVHGGLHYSDSIIVNDEAKKAIEECSDFAPLHNPANLIGIEACEAAMPGVTNVAVFDTAFHGTMPAKAYLYAIPREYYEKYGVRRYGFHGTSHSFVSKRTIEFAGLDADNSKVVVCHLGNGGSISAVVNGKCVDTSMGLTPLEGIIMGTRSGGIDPAVIEFVADKENKNIHEMIAILNKKSGVFGMSGGISSDFRDLKAAMDKGNERAIETIEAYTYKVAKYIGSYVAAMNGVDAITFTAGVGENSPYIRTMVGEYLGYLGIKIDEEANAKAIGEDMIISTEDSKVKVCIIPTNEELAIVRETVALIK